MNDDFDDDTWLEEKPKEGKRGKSSAEDTLRRRLALLSLLPTVGQPGLDVGTITARLESSGFSCGERTVLRDLKEIRNGSIWHAAGVALVSTPDPLKGNAQRWTHAGMHKPSPLRTPTGEEAMLLVLITQELQALLPGSAVDTLSTYAPATNDVLQRPGHTMHAAYRRKICNVPEGPLTIAPPVGSDHIREVNEALLRDEKIDVRYYAVSRRRESAYRLHPVGMVRKGLFFWLIAFKEEAPGRTGKDARMFRMDRIRSVTRCENDPVARGLPELKDVVDSGLLGYFPKDLVKLSLRSAPCEAGNQLIDNYRDTPFSHDQRIVKLPEGGYLLEASVRHTRELEWMLQGQAHLLEVVAPEDLRQTLQRFAASVADRYPPAAA